VLAEAHAAVMAEMVLSEVATRADLAEVRRDFDQGQAALRKDLQFGLAEVRKDLDRVRDQLTIRLGAILVVGLTALATLQTIL